MLTPQYRPRAAFDLESITIYVGEVLKSPKSARSLYIGIREKVMDLCRMPTTERVFRDDLLGREYRYFPHENYRIFYSYDEETLTVWRIVHTRQDIDDFALIVWDE